MEKDRTNDIEALVRYVQDMHAEACGRPCPIPPAELRDGLDRALDELDRPEHRLKKIVEAALYEAKAHGRLLEGLAFVHRFRLRDDLELRGRVREALGYQAIEPARTAPHPMEEDELLREFERYVRVEEGRADNTLRSYRQSVAGFRAFLAGRHLRLREATRQDVLAWKESLLERGNRTRTINVRLAGVKALFRFMEVEEHLDRDPTSKVRFMPEEKRRMPVLTANEVDRLLSVIDRETLGGLRDFFMIAFTFATGGRIGEITRLQVGDLDLERATVTFRHRKNKEDNVVSLTEESVALARHYLEAVRPAFQARAKDGYEDYVILSLRGRPMSRSYISRIVKRYSRLAKIDKDVTSHTLRRSVSTIMANNGMSAEMLQLFLGHKSIDTTLKNYIVYSQTGQRRALEEFHPLAEGRRRPRRTRKRRKHA